MSTTLEQQLRIAVAEKSSDLTNEQQNSIVEYTLEHAADLSSEWENISNNVDKGNHRRFGAAENLVYYGFAERENRPARTEWRRNWHTDERELVELGCRCFFRMKSDGVIA